MVYLFYLMVVPFPNHASAPPFSFGAMGRGQKFGSSALSSVGAQQRARPTYLVHCRTVAQHTTVRSTKFAP
jgi:hypothetical protein